MSETIDQLSLRLRRRASAAADKLLAMPPAGWLVHKLRPSPIFQIGFNKCGTTSLHEFLIASGIPSLHWESEQLATRIQASIDAGRDPIRDFPRTIGFTDMVAYRPGRIIEPYKHFDYLHRWYPNALFILNSRDRETWVASRSAHRWGHRTLLATYAEMLALPEARVPAYWRAEWDAHHTSVRAYFAGASNFLEFNIERDDPRRLIQFIGTRYPQCAGQPLKTRNARGQYSG